MMSWKVCMNLRPNPDQGLSWDADAVVAEILTRQIRFAESSRHPDPRQ
jgi:hypothetical protein